MTQPGPTAHVTRVVPRGRRRSAALFLALLMVIIGPVTAPATGAAAGPRLPGFLTTPKASVIDASLTDLLVDVGSAGPASAFVHFADDVGYVEGVTAIEDAGLTVGIDLPAAHAAYAFGSGGELVVLSRSPEVVRLESPGVERALLETATWATRARTLYEQTGGLDLRVLDHDGDNVDGAGVGIAIVDSGIDATHPDLRWAGFGEPDPQTIKNFKVECTTPVLVNTQTGQCFGPVIMQDVPDSDTTSGHGTHVAGISAGDGTASDSDGDPSTTGDRMFRGVAPGAKLYGFGTGEGLSILTLNAAAAFQWIYDNGLSQNPPIRVVNNSWGGAGPHDPNEVISKLANALIRDRGITVVFAAGNDDGDGSAIDTNRHANNPTPGLISVANYDDAESGSRNNQLDDSSSRGLAADPGTWPDLSAPGTFITSTCKITTVVCPLGATQTAYPPNYSAISGTSMAAPHTAGAIAMLYQADPTISPAEVEDVVEDTAYKFTAGAPYQADPANPDDASSFDKGHGLLDARLAVLDALGLPPNYGTGTGTGMSSVTIATPSDGEEVPPTFQVAGGADTGGGTGAVSTTTVIAEGDEGDHPIDALDLQKVTVSEDAAGGTVTVGWEVRGTTGTPATGTAYRLFNSIDGVGRRLQVNWNGTTPTCALDLAASCTAAKIGNTFAATYPATTLGAARGAVMFDVWAAAYSTVIQDRAPGPDGASFLVTPARGEEHVFVGGGGADPGPTGELYLSVDGGTAQPVGAGQGSFTWQTTVGPLAPGPHTLVAELQIGGTVVASDTVTVTVVDQRIQPDILITSPDDGTDVPATVIEVRGTSNSDPADGNASVRIRATGTGFDSGYIAATDTSASGRFTTWSANLDLDGQEGNTITVTAELRLDGTTADPDATDQVRVSVVATGGGGCDPRTIGFWRQQADQTEAAKFAPGEYQQLAERAAQRSEGYFGGAAAVTAALRQDGNAGPLPRAERQYAGLLLNFAAHDLSGNMSYTTGLDPATVLDPAVYDTTTVGNTAGQAASWVRSQLPSGDLGGSNEIADSINNGQGLVCE